MVFKIVLEFLGECDLRSLGVFELVNHAGGGGNKITKVRVVRIIDKGN